jgi:hypothetical protein
LTVASTLVLAGCAERQGGDVANQGQASQEKAASGDSSAAAGDGAISNDAGGDGAAEPSGGDVVADNTEKAGYEDHQWIRSWPLERFASDFSDTFMVGDSVMHLVEGPIHEYMPAATVDASSGRALEEGGPNEGYSSGLGILDIIRSDGGYGYERYVIGAACNEPSGMSYEAGEEIVGVLQGKPVWFVTQMVTNNSTSTSNTNAAIDALCANYPQVHKIDWYQACIEHPEYITDNAHASTEGAYVYASLIAEALAQ